MTSLDVKLKVLADSITQHIQQVRERAAYGKQQLKQLSQVLTERLGKGFDIGNLRNMRQFYLIFPNRDAVRSELSWTHYRALIRFENTDEQRKGHDDNPTIGLVLCSEKSGAVVKCSVLADQQQLFAAQYLPSEEELKRQLERERSQAIVRLQAKELRDE